MSDLKRPILLVDDSEDDIEFALRALRGAAVSRPIDVVRDGEEALGYLFDPARLASGALPALILLDIRLPKVDGLEVLRRVRADAAFSAVPVVVLSSSDAPVDIERAYALGANSFVRKPVEFFDYAETVGRVGHYWDRVNEIAEEAMTEKGEP